MNSANFTYTQPETVGNSFDQYERYHAPRPNINASRIKQCETAMMNITENL